MNQESLIDTIRRLLALSKSPNEHEAQLAAAKAAELMRRHNIEQATLEQSGDQVDEAVEDFERVPFVVKVVGDLIDKHFFVTCYAATEFGITSVQLFGSKENVAVAKYVYHVLTRTFRELGKQRSQQAGRRATKAYYLGLRDGYESAIQRHAGPTTQAERALIVCARRDRESALKAHLGRALAKAQTVEVDTYGDVESYYTGVKDGRNIQVNTALPAQHADMQRRLT